MPNDKLKRGTSIYIQTDPLINTTHNGTHAAMVVFPFPNFDVLVYAGVQIDSVGVDAVEGRYIKIVPLNAELMERYGSPNAAPATTANILTALKWCEERSPCK